MWGSARSAGLFTLHGYFAPEAQQARAIAMLADLFFGAHRCRRDGKMPQVCRHRGPLLIHASASCAREEHRVAAGAMISRGLVRHPRTSETLLPSIPDLGHLHRGGIIGICRAVAALNPDGGVTEERERAAADAALGQGGRRWHVKGQFGLVVADAQELPFLPCTGALGLWHPRCDVRECVDAVGARVPRRAAIATRYGRIAGVDRVVLLCAAHAAERSLDHEPLVPEKWRGQ